MAIPFEQTKRSLRGDGSRRTLASILAVTLLLMGWVAWLHLARVPVIVQASAARIEVGASAHAADARISGTVVATFVELGDRVQRGDPLLALDVSVRTLRFAEQRARRHALAAQLPPLRRAIDVEAAAVETDGGAVELVRREAQARHRAARSAAAVAHDDARRLSRLREGGYVADAEIHRARGVADQRVAEAEAERRSVARRVAEGQLRASDRQSHWLELVRRHAELEGELAVIDATIASLRREIEDATVTAPVDGRVGHLTRLTVGSVVAAGDRVASIVPDGPLRVVASVSAAEIGRIRPGQHARFAADAHPWVQFGTASATVHEVASEPVDGMIRLMLDRVVASERLPLEHGVTGTLEIETERVSPWVLVLRAAGQRVGER